MNTAELNAAVDRYIAEHWNEVVADIAHLISIPSVEDLETAAPGAPWGEGPRAALSAALDMATRMGFEAHDLEGYLGYADFAGETATQIGIIGHVDVVPEGPGWNTPAFELTQREGYFLGRGTSDDKAPVVVALHAMKFWKDCQAAGEAAPFPYTVRFLFGANEENGMGDVDYYRARFADPAFLFTPDAEFPVCYGEKGLFGGYVTGAPLEGGALAELAGGTAANAVPGEAHAVVRIANTAAAGEQAESESENAEAFVARLPEARGITVAPAGEGALRIDAQGKAAHASTPELGENAIALLADYLLQNNLCAPGAERATLELVRDLTATSDGAALGIACADEHFGTLTAVGGVVSLENRHITQTLDCRFPTGITVAEMEARVNERVAQAGATFSPVSPAEPFLVPPESPVIQALLSAYNEATGETATPFTMGGATYARRFTSAASFGPLKPCENTPDWVGAMHGPNEGISEELLKQALRIYIFTLAKLMELDL